MRVEAENNELILRHSNGDIAIIPSYLRDDVLYFLDKGDHNAITEMVKMLPKKENYNKPESQIPPSKKMPFEEWYKTVPEEINDTADYDLKAAYQELPMSILRNWKQGRGHLPDTYKKPTHITFSEESKYSTPERRGGKWYYKDGKDYFKPTQINIDNAGGIDKLKEYFQKYEPGVELDLSDIKE